MKHINLVFLFFSLLVLPSCQQCSHSGSRAKYEGNKNTRTYRNNSRVESTNKVRMRLDNGVYFVPIEINGVMMEFIFDTGASSISMSVTEVLFLYKQGLISENDFIGSQQFIDATGTISEGTIINLKSVKIGDKTLKNIQASVVHNLEAPLLLGQSALGKFGKISIDYNNKLITFER